jgi:hypothetical protein
VFISKNEAFGVVNVLFLLIYVIDQIIHQNIINHWRVLERHF